MIFFHITVLKDAFPLHFFYHWAFFVCDLLKENHFFITRVSRSAFFFLTGLLLDPFFPFFCFRLYNFFHDRGVRVNLCAPRFFSHYCSKRCFPLTLFFYNRASFFFTVIFSVQYYLKMCFLFFILVGFFICFLLNQSISCSLCAPTNLWIHFFSLFFITTYTFFFMTGVSRLVYTHHNVFSSLLFKKMLSLALFL